MDSNFSLPDCSFLYIEFTLPGQMSFVQDQDPLVQTL